MHAEGFSAGNLRRQVFVGQIDVGLRAAGDRRGAGSRDRWPSPHPFVVVSLEAGLAVGSGEKTVGHGRSIGTQELGSGDKRDGGVWELSMKAVEDGDNVRGLAGIVSDQRPGLVRKRTDDDDVFYPWFERKQTVVLEQDHGLIGKVACLRAVFRAVKFLLLDLCVGNHVWRVKQAELDPRGKQANQSSVQSAFRQIALLHRIDIGFFDRFAKP